MRQQRCAVMMVVVYFFLAAPPASTQVTTGTIVGTVTDADGVLPGAVVTVRDTNRGTRRRAT